MSTGNVLPGIWKIGTLPKNAANLSESIVAEVTMSFRSVRRDTTWHETANMTGIRAEHFKRKFFNLHIICFFL